VHVVDLPVLANSTALGAYLFLIDKLATARCDGTTASRGLLVGPLSSWIHHVAEGSHSMPLVDVHSRLILGLAGQLVVVVPAVTGGVLLSQDVLT